VLLRLAENHFWLSLADSDILLWAKGVAVHAELDVVICEPDVSPLQLQGPKSRYIMDNLFGNDVVDMLRYYWLKELTLDRIPLVVSRTGWSSELGYEIYLRDSRFGDELWERIMAAGKHFGLMPGHTSTIRRIEAGMLSYHADMDVNTNPFELGLERLVDLDIETEFIGKAALKQIAKKGVTRRLVGLSIDGRPLCTPNNSFWPVMFNDEQVGQVTSAVYSPRLKANIALAMIAIGHTQIGTKLDVHTCTGQRISKVVKKPFYDANKSLAKM
jgi:aminomethyltransferase